jgi:hypothetical protein
MTLPLALVLTVAAADPASAAVLTELRDSTDCVPREATEAAITASLPASVSPDAVAVRIETTPVQWEREVAIETRVHGRVHARTVHVRAQDCRTTPALVASIVARDAAPLVDEAGGRPVAELGGTAEAPDTELKGDTELKEDRDAGRAPVRRRTARRAAPDGDPLEDVGFVERYAPLTMDDDLVPELEDDWVWFVVGGLFATTGGHLWVPLLAQRIFNEDSDIPDGYFPAALKIVGVHMVPHMLVFFATFCAFPMMIFPPLGFAWFIGFWLINVFVNIPSLACNSLWLTPVALVNEYNRRAKVAPAAPRSPNGHLRIRADIQAY